MLDFETCQRLKKAGFPQDKSEMEYSPKGHLWPRGEFQKFHPKDGYIGEYTITAALSLDDLFGELGDDFEHLTKMPKCWTARSSRQPPLCNQCKTFSYIDGTGKTPEEALAHLFLSLHDGR